jgi:hypothetical protein
MNLGNNLLADDGIMLHNESQLFNLLVDMDLIRQHTKNKDERRKIMDTVFYDETECGAHVKFDQIGFNLTCIVEGSPAEFKERFDFPFHSHGLGEYLCDLEARTQDAWMEANNIPE